MNINTTDNGIAEFVKTITSNAKFFDILEGSNYVIMTSFDRHYIVEFEQAMLIMQRLFGSEADFVTINNSVLNKKYIQCIEPTQELTAKQKEEREKKNEELAKIEKRKDELMSLKRNFDAEFYNSKFGVDGWSLYHVKPNIRLISESEMKECWAEFEKKYPDEAKEIKDIKS